ncbi:MAG: crossover junction endodeoxyribonuclease RuvC [Bacteroidetes bacterium]|nr:MAG: crossover junction endodeoxyribonuclease RuvC [Bacteroidota bacterium]
MRIILGIDPGTQVTGYGIIQGQGKKMSLLAAGVIKMGRSEQTHPDKLKRIFQRVSNLVQEYEVTEMALEAPFYGKNPQSMLKLGRAQGVAMAAGLIHDLPIYEYAPRKVKVAVTGNGAASKEQVAQMLQHLLTFEEQPRYLDATDGLAVAVCHFFQSRLPGGSSKKVSDWGDFLRQNPDRVQKR